MKRQYDFKRTIIFILLMSMTLALSLQAYGEEAVLDYDLYYFTEIMDLVQKNYRKDISQEELLEGALKGLFYNLDEHSHYYTKEEFEALNEDLNGDFVGIGVYIMEEDGYIKVITPIEGSPAYKAGIKPGDIIQKVDGKDIKNMTTVESSNLMKGKAGTSVKLGIKRGKETKTFTVKREEVKINPISYEILNKKIGYIKISQFNQYTYTNITKALNQLDKNKVTNIIIDVRDNPGGYLDEVIEICKLFIPEGPIVHIKDRTKNIETYNSGLKKPKYKLVVLVNEYSASASEILAGAVKDRKVGQIVGVTTYGKGTVQQVIPLPYGDGMKLTIAEYLTPNKTSIDGKGIKPDVVVEDEDQQLKRAVELLKK